MPDAAASRKRQIVDDSKSLRDRGPVSRLPGGAERVARLDRPGYSGAPAKPIH
jgi:hypothetical protein